MNLDGKNGFIGCQHFRPGDGNSHRFVSIYRDVKEEFVIELLRNNGKFTPDVGA
jgi:hypothetical protein